MSEHTKTRLRACADRLAVLRAETRAEQHRRNTLLRQAINEDGMTYTETARAGRLTTGNVVTIEPGVYLAGSGGIRIEDLVVVTDDGAEVFSSYTKDLVTLN